MINISALSKENRNFEAARNEAIYGGEGHEYQILILRKETKENQIYRVAGVEVLDGQPYLDGKNRQKFTTNIIGGELRFIEEQRGQKPRAYILVTEHNKEFLASHFHIKNEDEGDLNPWLIKDPDFKKEIVVLHKKMIAENQKNNHASTYKKVLEFWDIKCLPGKSNKETFEKHVKEQNNYIASEQDTGKRSAAMTNLINGMELLHLSKSRDTELVQEKRAKTLAIERLQKDLKALESVEKDEDDLVKVT